MSLQISHSSKKCEIKFPESRKKLTTEHKFCFMDVDAKRSGGGVGYMRTTVAREGKNWQNLAEVFYGWPLINDKKCFFKSL